nr:sugar phosphate isomerase/epimerase [Paenibacillus apiarius]
MRWNKVKIGLQLYTVRDETAKDFAGTLEKVAAMGYDGVEFAGYGGLQPQELAVTLERLNLQAAGSHVSIEQLIDHLDEQIEMNAAIGNRHVICPGLGESRYNTLAALQETAAHFARAAERLAEHGIKLGYHNHDFEFTTKLGEQTMFDTLFQQLPAEKLFTELDVCWVQYGGYDPLSVIAQYTGRIPLVHFKDLKRTEEGKPLTVELGLGELDLMAIAQASRDAGAEWLIVEQDECQRPSLDSVKNSRQWIKNNLGK